jgi:hypothetical protein
MRKLYFISLTYVLIETHSIMKNVIIIGCLFLLLGCKTKMVNGKSMGKSVETTEMSPEEGAQKNKAYELGKRILITCNNVKFKPFTQSEATEKVIAKSTPENIKKICVKYNLKYGLFKDLEFIEMIPNKTDNTNVFRFKALFEYAKANKELRVTMNSENKASAISTKDWKDEFE